MSVFSKVQMSLTRLDQNINTISAVNLNSKDMVLNRADEQQKLAHETFD